MEMVDVARGDSWVHRGGLWQRTVKCKFREMILEQTVENSTEA